MAARSPWTSITAVAGPLRAALVSHPRFNAAHLSSWAGLTPKRRESDTVVRRGPITKQVSTLVRWAAVEAAQGARNAGWLDAARSRIETSPPRRYTLSPLRQ
jgi:transposase